MTLSRGFRFGAYEIVEPIGAGGMGDVYRAHDLRLDRSVAIKVLTAANSGNAEHLARFRREARTLAALNHPHIAQVYGLEDVGPDVALVMELVEGRTLAAVLRDARGHRLPWAEAAAIAVQIADALDAASAQGIVHRDLKPANVMIRPDGVVKVLDFGLAKTAPKGSGPEATGSTFAATEPGVVVGTAAYMSPEQARGVAVDHRTDVWAFGCVVFEMVSGKRAFEGATASDVIAAILRGAPDWSALPADLPSSMRRMLKRCLAPDLSERLRAIGDAKLELRDASNDAAMAAPPRSSARLAWVVTAVALIVIAAGLITVPSRITTSPAPTFEKVSFRRGYVHGARFGADQSSVVYTAFYDGGSAVYESRIGRPEARPLGAGRARIFAVSKSGEFAIGLAPEFPLTYLAPARLAELPPGGAPRELSVNVNAADYSADGRSMAAAIVDRGARVEWPLGTTVYKTDGAIGSLRISPAGDRVAFFEYGQQGNAVKILDRKGQVETLSDGWQVTSGGLAWSPSGDEVWLSGSRAGQLSQLGVLYAVAKGGQPRTVLELPGGVRLQDIAADGRVLLLNSHPSNSLFVGTESGREQDLAWFGESIVNDISSDGSRIALLEPGRQGERGFVLFHRPTTGGPAVRISDNITGFETRFSGDGALMASLEVGGAIRVDPIGGGAAIRLTDPGWRPLSLAWAPEGQRLFYQAVSDAREIKVFERGLSADPPRRIDGACSTTGLAIDPGGRQLACVGRGAIQFIPIDGSAPRVVPTSEPPGQLIRWSSDGRTLYSYRGSDLPGALLGIDIATGAVRRERTLTPDDMAGIWRIHPVTVTADGQHYAYSASRSLGELLVFTGLR